MYSIHNRDDLEKLKNLQETKSLLRKERLKEKLGKQNFHYDLEEVFEPVTAKQAEATENQKRLSEKQIQSRLFSWLLLSSKLLKLTAKKNITFLGAFLEPSPGTFSIPQTLHLGDLFDGKLCFITSDILAYSVL